MPIHRLPLVLLLPLAGCGGDSTDFPEASRDALRVNAVQGAGATSPYEGENIVVRGIVSADFQDNDANEKQNLGGFYLRSVRADDDPRTSEGLFVFDRFVGGADVEAGDVVEVTGSVSERFGETQLMAGGLRKLGRSVAPLETIELPADAITESSDGVPVADLERYEGMYVRVTGPLYVQDQYNLQRYGELLLSTAGREAQFTSLHQPDIAAWNADRERFAAHTLILDDGSSEENRLPVRYADAHVSDNRAPRVGDAVYNLVGVLRYSRGSGSNGVEGWRLEPVREPRFDVVNPRPVPPRVGGNLQVASFNVLNFFSSLDTGNANCGPRQSAGCRGADSAEELERQRAKLALAINQLGAEVVGLMELENNPQEAIRALVDSLNARRPGWSSIDTGIVGSDAIRVAIVYRADAVEPVGDWATLDGSIDERFNDRRNRPALAQSFRAVDGGGVFTVTVNHLKSKGSSCEQDGDPDRGDGQGNCSATRTRAAAALADWLAGDPTGSGDPDHLVIGDLNAYLNEEPLLTLEGKGYVNLLRRDIGREAYTYVFRGRSGALDHALATVSMAAQVQDVAVWHINADEAPIYDYNLDFDRNPQLFDGTTPWRASDHDPVLIGLSLNR